MLSGMVRHPSTAGRRPAVLALLAVTALLGTAGCGSGKGSAGSDFTAGKSGFDTAAPGSRKPAPDITGRTLKGGTLHLSAFRGKVVVVNIWGSWCPPCRAEAPGFETVYEKYHDRGVQFVGINTRDLSVKQGQRFEDRFHITYPSIFDPDGRQILRFPRGLLNLELIPSTLVIDRGGRIAARAIKPLGQQELGDTVAQVLTEGH
jgi:peroxiredoxin